jgi:hypothetical protein
MGKEEILSRFSNNENELNALADCDPHVAIERACSLVPNGMLGSDKY